MRPVTLHKREPCLYIPIQDIEICNELYHCRFISSAFGFFLWAVLAIPLFVVDPRLIFYDKTLAMSVPWIIFFLTYSDCIIIDR